MQVEDARVIPEEVIVERGDFEAVVEKRRHHWIDLVLGQNEIAHEHFHPAGALRHRNPSAKSEWRRRSDLCYSDAQVVAGNVHLQHVGLVVPLFAECVQDLLVFSGYLLCPTCRPRAKKSNHRTRDRERFHGYPPTRTCVAFRSEVVSTDCASGSRIWNSDPPRGRS
jgi:hypothetical protein